MKDLEMTGPQESDAQPARAGRQRAIRTANPRVSAPAGTNAPETGPGGGHAPIEPLGPNAPSLSHPAPAGGGGQSSNELHSLRASADTIPGNGGGRAKTEPKANPGAPDCINPEGQWGRDPQNHLALGEHQSRGPKGA